MNSIVSILIIVSNVIICRTFFVEMKDKKKKIIFKRPTVLATLKIPTPDEIPYSPSYKRFFLNIRADLICFLIRKTPKCLSLDLVEIDNLNMVDVAKPEGVFTNTKSKEKVNQFW